LALFALLIVDCAPAVAQERPLRREFEPGAFESMQLVVRVDNEMSLEPQLPVLLDIAIVNYSRSIFFTEPSVYKQ
jgi:hypothetical protein